MSSLSEAGGVAHGFQVKRLRVMQNKMSFQARPLGTVVNGVAIGFSFGAKLGMKFLGDSYGTPNNNILGKVGVERAQDRSWGHG